MNHIDCGLNINKFGCKAYMVIGFDRPASLGGFPSNQVKNILPLDTDLSPCKLNSTKCTKQFYRLQLPSSGKYLKISSF